MFFYSSKLKEKMLTGVNEFFTMSKKEILFAGKENYKKKQEYGDDGKKREYTFQ